MNLINIISSPWAIIQDRFFQICNILNAHLHGPKLNLKDIETKILTFSIDSGNSNPGPGIGIIPILGPIMKSPDIFDRVFFGAVSSAKIKSDFMKMISDPGIKKIILYIDSPGGTVDGTQELAQTIFDNRGAKEILAYSDGLIASAAYWIGSAADKIFISGDTVDVGSIGVISTHVDWSEQDKMYGIRTTEIVAGKYKNIASPNKPLSDAGKEFIQERVDYLYSIFVSDVARNRGTSIGMVLDGMADAKIFIGKQAIDVGLVDGISAIEALIDDSYKNNAAGVAVKNLKFTEATNMAIQITVESLKNDAPDVYKSVFEAGKAETQAEFDKQKEVIEAKGFANGEKAELERIKSIKEAGLPGHDKLIDRFILDGKTTGAEAAMAIIKAEGEVKAAALSALSAQKPIPGAVAPELVGDQVDPNAPVEDRAKTEWDKSAETRKEFGTYEVFLAYLKAAESGNARILKGKEVAK